jgi:hypothetical protein
MCSSSSSSAGSSGSQRRSLAHDLRSMPVVCSSATGHLSTCRPVYHAMTVANVSSSAAAGLFLLNTGEGLNHGQRLDTSRNKPTCALVAVRVAGCAAVTVAGCWPTPVCHEVCLRASFYEDMREKRLSRPRRGLLTRHAADCTRRECRPTPASQWQRSATFLANTTSISRAPFCKYLMEFYGVAPFRARDSSLWSESGLLPVLQH